MMRRSYQQGYLMIVAVALIVMVGFLGMSVAYLFNIRSRASLDNLLSTQAFYLAETGLDTVPYYVVNPNLGNRIGCSGTTTTAVPLGKGVYGVSPTLVFATAARISNGGSPISATATTIPVTSTTGYASSGRILIDREFIDYNGTTSTSFTGVVRGRDGTTATTHANNTPIGQFQCSVVAQGGVPNLNTPSSPGNPVGKRILSQATQLQYGWVVAANLNTTTRVFLSWGRPTENSWIDSQPTGTSVQPINGISMLSQADGWAVGNAESSNLTFLRWNGTSWTKVLPAVTIGVALNSVYCNNTNDCWAVGGANSNTPVIERWNGTSWGRVTPTANANAALNSVHCISTTDCWAVGASVGGVTFLIERWNGTNWSRVLPAANFNVALNSVYCNNTNDCWAVGANTGGAFLIERWNGTNWSRVLPAANFNVALNSVYCNSTTDCWAVGAANANNPVIERWNGTTWSRVTPTGTSNGALNAVSCFNSKDCWAVGAVISGVDLIMHWDGTSWSRYDATGLPAVTLNDLALVGANSKPNAAWQEKFP